MAGGEAVNAVEGGEGGTGAPVAAAAAARGRSANGCFPVLIRAAPSRTYVALSALSSAMSAASCACVSAAPVSGARVCRLKPSSFSAAPLMVMRALAASTPTWRTAERTVSVSLDALSCTVSVKSASRLSAPGVHSL